MLEHSASPQADAFGGQATENLLKRASEAGELIPGLEARTADAVAQQARVMNQIDKVAALGLGGTNPALMRLREVLAQGGLPALRSHIARHGLTGLPAVAAAAPLIKLLQELLAQDRPEDSTVDSHL